MAKVLVIDDNREQAEIISQFMLAADLDSEIITDSAKALDRIEKYDPDVIILDIMMPHLDGLTLLKLIRDQKKFDHIKVIIYTAKNFDVDRRKALDLGADLFLAKPTRGHQMIEHVKNLAGVASFS